MIKFLVGAMFGFIFGWLWWSQRGSRTDGSQYNRQVAAAAPEAVADRSAERAEANRLKTELEVCEQRARALRQTVDSQATELRTLKRQLDSSGNDKTVRLNEFNALQTEHTALRRQLAERETAIKELQAQLQTTQQIAVTESVTGGEEESLRTELDEKNTALIEMDTQLKSLQIKLDERSAQLQELEQKAAERDQLQQELAGSNELARTLQSELASKTAALSDTQEQQRALQAQIEATTGQLQELENQTMVIEVQKAQLQNLQAQLEAMQTESPQLADDQDEMDQTGQHDLHAELADAEADLAAKAEIIQNLRNELEALRSGRPAAVEEEEEVDIEALKASLPKATTDRDNLKKIKGIASVIEGLLNDLGITTFRQITLLDETQIRQVARALKTFPDRMHRDNWIEQARELHKKKYSEDI
jgi:predicted flap endonuclease-1-like 5' DNA nuclease